MSKMVFKMMGLSLLFLVVFCDEAFVENQPDTCSQGNVDGCVDEGPAKSRQKRFMRLPLLTTIGIQSRLIVPQLPVGFYLVWVKIRFFLRVMFTDSLIGQSTNPAAIAFAGRALKEGSKFLMNQVAHSQGDLLKRMEASLSQSGLNGRQCVLRAICEFSETPIKDWSLIGETLMILFAPKEGNHTFLEDYRMAEQIGRKGGDCWSEYSECPISVFNFIPDVYAKDDTVPVKFRKEDVDLDEEIQKLRDSDQILKEFNVNLDVNS